MPNTRVSHNAAFLHQSDLAKADTLALLKSDSNLSES